MEQEMYVARDKTNDLYLYIGYVPEKDNKEIAQVSPDDDLDALSEKIKNAAANQEVSDTYENEGSKSMNNNTKRLQKPYCAVYP